MKPITYVIGDATAPIGDGIKVIAHCCNDIGVWGAGFVLAVSARWPKPERIYRETKKFVLGQAQFVNVAPDIIVANIIGQRGVAYNFRSGPPIRYSAITEGMAAVAVFAEQRSASVHMPRIGCGLAGGDWSNMEQIITAVLCNKDIPVFVYDLPTTKSKS